MNLHHFEQFGNGIGCSLFLPKSQKTTDKYNGKDDYRIGSVTKEYRKNGSDKKQQCKGTFEL